MIKNITIAIQARSNSTRFPGKVLKELWNGEKVIDRMVRVCNGSASYLNKYAEKNKYFAHVVVCVPEKDPLVEYLDGKVDVFQGPEADVLSRFSGCAIEYKSDYIIRITSDCPRIPEHVISAHVSKGFHNRMDYLSNTIPEYRTAPDGWDCEFVSRKLLMWADLNATGYDREHVTTLMKRNPPPWAKVGPVIGFIKLNEKKISLDTPEELDEINSDDSIIELMLEQAIRKYGKTNVHRL